MSEQYSGQMIVDLMHKVDRMAVPRPKVEVGGKIVNVGSWEVRVGPEVIESFRQIMAEKQAAIASGKPFTQGHWEAVDPQVKAQMRAIAKEAGFPEVFD